MNNVVAAPEFRELTDEDIEHALDVLESASEDELNVHPILREIERLIDGYSDRFEALCEERGGFPEELLDFEPAYAIERAAYDIFSDALHDSLQAADDE